MRARVDAYPRAVGDAGLVWVHVTEEMASGGIGPGHFSLRDTDGDRPELSDVWARLERQLDLREGIVLDDVPAWLFARRQRQWRHDPQRERQYRYICDALRTLLDDAPLSPRREPIGDGSTLTV